MTSGWKPNFPSPSFFHHYELKLAKYHPLTPIFKRKGFAKLNIAGIYFTSSEEKNLWHLCWALFCCFVHSKGSLWSGNSFRLWDFWMKLFQLDFPPPSKSCSRNLSKALTFLCRLLHIWKCHTTQTHAYTNKQTKNNSRRLDAKWRGIQNIKQQKQKNKIFRTASRGIILLEGNWVCNIKKMEL